MLEGVEAVALSPASRAWVATHLLERLKAEGVKGLAAEGKAQADWVLIDGGDIIVHLFRPEVRTFYDLEKIWGDSVPRPTEVA